MTTAIMAGKIDAILRFLPVLDSEEFKVGDWHTEEGMMPLFVFSDEARAFQKALHENGWIVPFDWPDWQDEAAKLVDSPDPMASADIETIRKLLTTHVRKERFCEGHLNVMHKRGHLCAILRRLAELRVDAR